MWIYTLLLALTVLSCSESRRNALQDYQRTDGVRLVLVTPSPSHLTKSRKVSLIKCARTCSRNKKLPFTCRAFLYDHQNRKCQWLSFDRNSPVAHTQHDINTRLYQKKDYIRECIMGTGQSYRGRRSVTVSGILCQAWASSIPHEHQFLSKPFDKKDLRKNYCRNPDNSTDGPWCFTTDPHLRHQECGIPQCSQVECIHCNGEDYRGPIDHTESGKECQRWDLEEPHKHQYHPDRYPDKGLDDNYCRNPDGRHRPWCFTTDPKTSWEYCSIKVCESPRKRTAVETRDCYLDKGEAYRGTVDTTPTGLTCQRWDSQYPHNHSFIPEAYPCKELRENYCRNPDGQEFPWCFTTDPRVRTMSCTNIPQCGFPNKPDCYEGFGEKYRGEQSRTRSNLLCSPWEEHSNSGERGVTVEGLERNYCRNPDKDKHGPWCYTNNSAIRWDYCNVKPCDATQSTVAVGELSSVGCFVHKRTRIVGGSPLSVSAGSWMVSIQKGSSHWCGGSLIREEWVLTDRQCFSSCVPDLSEYRVWLGVSDIASGGPDGATRQEIRIAQVICGPEGSSLALLRLSKPALPADNVHTIQLPVDGCSIPEGTLCKMYGWGETKGTGYDGILKAVNLPMVSNEKCREQHRGSLHITNSKICAGGRRNEGVCERDYGGPLVCQDGELKVIIGVSVHGRGCARANRPAIFINVPFYTQWIYKVFRHYPESELSAE
ncbi:hepatocyte growth factor [Corythoichthys intestinalis]|uniref:hepatocyte growth factor n=1 Tax=Corythoichthys intestinalis TaxID=161448 RepID=UPI0025A61CF3|nr:hepatocyte growth factor [Corythoichthys intestinalis]XP_061812439.1 hepatocyte growth factor-like [Nerophis lumbriciformis]